LLNHFCQKGNATKAEKKTKKRLMAMPAGIMASKT